MFLNDNIQIISEVLKTYTNEEFKNINDIVDIVYKLDDSKRLDLIESINEKIGKNISLDIFSIYAANIMSYKTKNCRIIAVGTEYVSLKSKMIKKLGLNEKDEFVNLNQISKMSLKERMDHKAEVDKLNSNYNIYEDILNFLKNSKSDSGSKKIEQNAEKIYNNYVINDVNETIINNILNNREIYSAFIIVRKDRLNNLHDKIIDQIKF
jgi:hypothetical protein